MNKTLVIVFVKNPKLGKVKTRLAKSIGNEAALAVYSKLLKVTENAVKKLDTDVLIYFSEHIEEEAWHNFNKNIQHGKDLGERMRNAFQQGFEDGYERIALIGSDLPDISENHIKQALHVLTQNEVVFGPAKDGGYYLIGLSKMHTSIFQNKPWSQPNLLSETLKELHKNNTSFITLETLNDIDTYEDLIASKLYQDNFKLQEKTKQLHD
ncbi:TIGR04282 family arsenosugar biosynthesis glycosyltransferase [Flavobacteriaceae bacterium GSB9]|nr:TIGR04282 family arsenosugar biosynthesis glycosyltransferase [Flavobacteriaceae bacterium GSB9]